MVPNRSTIVTQSIQESMDSPHKALRQSYKPTRVLDISDQQQTEHIDRESAGGSEVTFGSNNAKDMKDKDFMAFKYQMLKGEYQQMTNIADTEMSKDSIRQLHAANEESGEPSYEPTPQTDRVHARAIHNIYPETFDMQLLRFQQTQDEKLKFKTDIHLNQSSVLYN